MITHQRRLGTFVAQFPSLSSITVNSGFVRKVGRLVLFLRYDEIWCAGLGVLEVGVISMHELEFHIFNSDLSSCENMALFKNASFSLTYGSWMSQFPALMSIRHKIRKGNHFLGQTIKNVCITFKTILAVFSVNNTKICFGTMS